MNFANIAGGSLRFTVMMSVMVLIAACNTATAPVRSSGPSAPPSPPGSPGSPGSSGPSVQVEAPGIPGAPGMPGLPSTGSGDAAGAPAPGTISVPAPQAGLPSGEPGGASATAQSGARQKPGGSQSAAGTGGEKTEDEILAEALEALERRPAPGQQGEDAAGRGSGTGAGSPAVTDAEKKQALGKELEQGFAEFDRVMLGEQQANNKRADQEGYGEFPRR